MGKALRSWSWLVILLSLFVPASAQVNGSQPTPLRFQPSPVYHPATYYPCRDQRLLLQLSSTEYHVFRNTEVDLDSSLIHAAQWLGISRLPVLDEGFGKTLPADSLAWFGRRDPAPAIRSLPAAHGPARLHALVLLGAYYAFQPAGHRDSASFYLQAARAESRLLHESTWDRQALCLMGKLAVQGDSLQRGNSYFDECIRECRRNADQVNEAKSWAWRGLYTRYSATTTYDRIASLQRARVIYHTLGDAEGEINVLTNIGYLYVSDIRLKKGEEVFKEALRLEDSIGFAYTHYTTDNIAMVTCFQGRYGEPLGFCLQTVKTAENLRDSLLMGGFYQRLSALYDMLDVKAGDCVKYAQKAFDRFLVDKGDAFLYVSITPIVNEMFKRHEAAKALVLEKDLAKREPPRSASAAERYHYMLGQCYEQLNQYDSAEVHILAAAQLTKKLELLHGSIFASFADYQLGRLYFYEGKYGHAKRYLLKCLREKNGSIPLSNSLWAYEELAKIDSISGDYPAQARDLQTYSSLQRSNITIQSQRQTEELAVRYETEHMEQQIQLRDQRIALLQQADQLRQSSLRQTMLVQRMTIAGIFVLLVIAALLVRQNRQRKKMNRLIGQKNDVITNKNEALLKALAEKEWLLKEVNHRVKNNLQTVISLLETQGRYLKNEALEAIVSGQHRVYAMLLLHQKITQAENSNAIEISDYLDDIIQHLRESFDNPKNVLWHLELQPLRVGLRQAVPIALIVNESVTNALKYAFPAGRNGDIAVRLLHEKGKVSLSISDNGIGLNGSADDAASGSMGIVLMKGLSEELRGKIQICSDNGTTVSVRF